jgi:hypothetical protein
MLLLYIYILLVLFSYITCIKDDTINKKLIDIYDVDNINDNYRSKNDLVYVDTYIRNVKATLEFSRNLLTIESDMIEIYCPLLIARYILEEGECDELTKQIQLQLSWTLDGYDYISCIKEAINNETHFNIFKSDYRYYAILEHIQPKWGELYFNRTNENNKNYILDNILMNRIKENELYGNPLHRTKIDKKIYLSTEVGNALNMEQYITIPSTNLRYLFIVSEVEKYLLYDYKKSDISIAEIGVGYGGQSQAFFARFLSSFNLITYTYFDINEVLVLVDKYISKFDWIKNINTIANTIDNRNSNVSPTFNYVSDMDKFKGNVSYDLCISNYAICEFSISLADQYIDKVLKYCKKGYITYTDEGYRLHMVRLI